MQHDTAKGDQSLQHRVVKLVRISKAIGKLRVRSCLPAQCGLLTPTTPLHQPEVLEIGEEAVPVCKHGSCRSKAYVEIPLTSQTTAASIRKSDDPL